jgi:hypothetical protein
MPPLKLNPSKEEVWSNNYQKIKEFYEANEHLNLPRKDPQYARLYKWLSYQRRPSKLLRKDQSERLESIHYKTVRFHRDEDKKESCTRVLSEQENGKLRRVVDVTDAISARAQLANKQSHHGSSISGSKVNPAPERESAAATAGLPFADGPAE